MTRSHRNEDRGGEHRWTFNGVEYPTRKLMCEARRAEYVRLLDEEGMNFTQAAHAVGVSKRTGKAWRNGRTRATGRNEKPLVDWYRSTMDKPKTLHPRYLSQEERIQIADRLRLGDSIRAIARLLGRDPGVCVQLVVAGWGWCRFVGLVVDSITTNHATRPSSRRRSMMLMPNSVLIRLSRYQTM